MQRFISSIVPPLLAVVACACATTKLDERGLANVAVEPAAVPQLDATHALGLDEVGRAAIARNPSLVAQRAAIAVKDAESVRAGTWPDPNMTIGLAQPIASTTDKDTGASLAVDWDLGALITKDAEHNAALYDADAARLALKYAELVVAGEARIAAARVASLMRQQHLADLARTSTQALLQTTLDARAAGDATIEDVGVRQVAALDAESRALEIAGSLDEARGDLCRALGVPPGTPVDVAEPGAPPDVPGDIEALSHLARSQRADLIALERAYASHEAVLDAAVLGELPHLSISVEGAHDPAGYYSAGGGATISLPIFDGNRAAVAVERATREQLRAEYAARLFETRADIAKIVSARARAQVARAALSARLQSLQDAASALAQAHAEHNATTLAYTEVDAALVDAQLKLMAIEEDEIEQQLALQTAVGAPLVGGAR